MRAPIRIAPGNIRNTTGGGPRASQRRLFFLNDPAPTEIYTLSLHDVLPILVTKLEGLLAQQPLDDAALTSTTEQLFADRKSTRLNSSHVSESRMPSSA